MANPEIQNPLIRLLEQYPATSNIIIAVVVFILGILIEYKVKLINKTKNILRINNKQIDKSKKEQKQSMKSSSNGIQQSVITGNIENKFFGSGYDVGDPKKALELPSTTNLNSEQLFICEQIKILFQNKNRHVDVKKDYEIALGYLKKGEYKNAAELYVRNYLTFNEYFKDSNEFLMDIRAELTDFDNSLKRLLSFADGEIDNFTQDILSDVEDTAKKLLRKR